MSMTSGEDTRQAYKSSQEWSPDSEPARVVSARTARPHLPAAVWIRKEICLSRERALCLVGRLWLAPPQAPVPDDAVNIFTLTSML